MAERRWNESLDLDYDRAGLKSTSKPGGRLLKQAEAVQLFVSSDLPRATESVLLLAGVKSPVDDPDFREAELPVMSLPWLSLPPQGWLPLLRLFWLVGYSPRSESFKAFCKRVRRAAHRLVEYAEQHGEVLLVAHGVLLHFLARELQRVGWSRQMGESRGYWGCIEMVRRD